MEGPPQHPSHKYMPDVMTCPTTPEGWRATSDKFLQKWNFPHTCGAIQGGIHWGGGGGALNIAAVAEFAEQVAEDEALFAVEEEEASADVDNNVQ